MIHCITEDKEKRGAPIIPWDFHDLGVPILKDMYGRVLNEIFEEGSRFDRLASYRRQSEEERIKDKIKEMKALSRA